MNESLCGHRLFTWESDRCLPCWNHDVQRFHYLLALARVGLRTYRVRIVD